MTEPYYSSPRQRLFRFANGHGASVVKFADGTWEITTAGRALLKRYTEPPIPSLKLGDLS